ncbi:cyclic nucleotide-binding domain-containing protein, partial [bacterium]|nr:cyclic nucleotide-binding domain-containing protein [bacterium]
MDLRAVLATSPAFAGLSAKALSLIAEAAREQLVRSGEVLFEQGDRSHGLYVIASGRLALTVPGTDGEARRLRELGRGEVVGGVSLLSGEGRTTGVVALRDSLLVVVSKAHFDRISEQHPHDAVEVSRHLVKQMLLSVSARSEPPDARSLNTIALVPGHPGLDMQGIGDALSAALSAYGPSVRIDAERVDGALGAGAARAKFEAEVDSGRVTTWLGGMEARYRTLVYTSDDTDTPWTRRALRQADRVLVVVDGAASHRETPMIKLLRALDLNVPVELLVVHVAGARRRAEPAEWVDLCGACGHQQVMGRDAADFGRVARLLTGHGLGLVLGGGGARGCAPLGLLKAGG